MSKGPIKTWFSVPHWYVESGIVPRSGPMSKAERDACLAHILSMSFMTSGPKAETRRVAPPHKPPVKVERV
jgi:hypothetical protein